MRETSEKTRGVPFQRLIRLRTKDEGRMVMFLVSLSLVSCLLYTTSCLDSNVTHLPSFEVQFCRLCSISLVIFVLLM